MPQIKKIGFRGRENPLDKSRLSETRVRLYSEEVVMKTGLEFRWRTVALAAVFALGTCLILIGCGGSPTTADESTSPTDDTASPEGEFVFSSDVDCSVCHTAESESMADEACLASLHTAIACVGCHTDIDTLASVHDGVAYGDKTSKRLKNTDVTEETCTECHGSYEELAQTSAASTVLTDTNGTVVNPHALPAGVEDHASITCGSCHEMHSPTPIEETAKAACLGCHHMGVYECYTCHD